MQFVEYPSGMVGLIETGRTMQDVPQVTDEIAKLSWREQYRHFAGAKASFSKAMESALIRSERLQQLTETMSDPDSSPPNAASGTHFYNAGEQEWFRQNFCNGSQQCVQGFDLTAPSPRERFRTGMARVVFSAILLGGVFAACGSRSPTAPDGGAGAGGDAAGAAGQSGAAGALPDAAAMAGAGGGADAAGEGEPPPDTGGGEDAPDGSDGDASGAVSEADASSSDGDAAGADGASILEAVRTKGCGQDPGFATGSGSIDTMGVKDVMCADTKCGPWMYAREYFLRLPAGYDNTRAYPLVFEPVSCGGSAWNIASLPDVDDTVIRVGLGPPPNEIGHSTNPNQGCPDNAEGDDSVDWAFYETLYDELAKHLCFDRNRVFALGIHHGGTSADQLACKYAGDATRPIRGVLTDGGGLFTASQGAGPQPMRVPTCTTKPLAAMWIDGTGNTTIPFTFVLTAIARTMKVDGCTMGTGFRDAMFEPFPIGGDQPDGTCKKVLGCPETSPIVVCALNNNYSANASVRTPGFTAFLKLFESAPLGAPPLP